MCISVGHALQPYTANEQGRWALQAKWLNVKPARSSIEGMFESDWPPEGMADFAGARPDRGRKEENIQSRLPRVLVDGKINKTARCDHHLGYKSESGWGGLRHLYGRHGGSDLAHQGFLLPASYGVCIGLCAWRNARSRGNSRACHREAPVGGAALRTETPTACSPMKFSTDYQDFTKRTYRWIRSRQGARLGHGGRIVDLVEWKRKNE